MRPTTTVDRVGYALGLAWFIGAPLLFLTVDVLAARALTGPLRVALIAMAVWNLFVFLTRLWNAAGFFAEHTKKDVTV